MKFLDKIIDRANFQTLIFRKLSTHHISLLLIISVENLWKIVTGRLRIRYFLHVFYMFQISTSKSCGYIFSLRHYIENISMERICSKMCCLHLGFIFSKYHTLFRNFSVSQVVTLCSDMNK